MREVKCPRCGRAALFAPENPFRPFCSERCKLIDLGDWASEKYAIPVENPTPDDLMELEEKLQAETDVEDSDAEHRH